MKLHQNKVLFKDAVLAASQRFGIPEIYNGAEDEFEEW